MVLVLPVFLCLASGLVLVRMAWSRSMPPASDLLLQLSLSVGYGLGIFSVVFFLSRVAGITNLTLVDVGVLALLLAGFFLLRARSAPRAIPVSQEDPTEPLWFRRALTAAFALALCAALYSAVMRSLTHPHGDGWDSFAIWNLHARFLFLGGPHWRDGFTPVIQWSHPDYPLLLPAAIAHFWTYLRNDDPRVPAVIGLLFTFSTVGLLFSSLSILRGRLTAMLGGMALLATPAFFEVSAWQYADIPLGFFFLAAIALFCLHGDRGYDTSRLFPGLLALAGLATGFAAWTKNEGLLFLCAIILARLFILFRRKRPSANPASDNQLAPLLLAAAPILLMVIYFKRSIAPPTDLFSDPATILHKLLSAPRYWAVINWFTIEFFRFGHWLWVPATALMVGYYFAIGKENRRPHRLNSRISRLALALTLAGYFAIYLITPYEIWHLRFSLDRLFLQLWPSTIFLFFLAVPGRAGMRGAGTSARCF